MIEKFYQIVEKDTKKVISGWPNHTKTYDNPGSAYNALVQLVNWRNRDKYEIIEFEARPVSIYIPPRRVEGTFIPYGTQYATGSKAIAIGNSTVSSQGASASGQRGIW